MIDLSTAQNLNPSPLQLRVEEANPACVEGRRLINLLWTELGQLYGNTGPCQFTPNQIAGERAVFTLAKKIQTGETVGCGAIVPLEGNIAEVKRVFVEHRLRRQGVAQQILQDLESRARNLGYIALRLETGIRQPGAAKLYQSCGFQEIAAFGSYVGDPLSICFEKILQPLSP